ncbi:snare associated Golgi protein-domain-containing protein [Phialemonium atrogriseum]|uniref:Golgi apparatus membrane protein TVP38 n=1 Tax=Phialemonium atrogriseum TaxID=1093897 RepID=A0AAJ0CA81_9PEZI|nr:snare associated Golgi protein-domain-containing protein [Phialemonium atrogriseum]KAK1772810.1 snare associated Golgi protein-domain-containing protein [Phialemonium atrogriseum]
MSDLEMSRTREGQSDRDVTDDTEYKPTNWKRILFAPKFIPWHLLGIAILVATILISIHHDQVIEALRPFSEKVRDIPAGWLIPIAILILISFPPLFGHEVVAVLCGVVYGLWIGFAIVAAGTFFGEVGTWFAFKHTLRKKAVKLEKTNLNYGALARLTRDGGFWIVFIIRFSAIPSHFSTAVFSTGDVRFRYFAIATLLTLPKQIILVYLGVLLARSGDDVDDRDGDATVKKVVLAVGTVVTVALAAYIWFKMRQVKVVLLQEQAARKEEREKARLAASEANAAGWPMPQDGSPGRV